MPIHVAGDESGRLMTLTITGRVTAGELTDYVTSPRAVGSGDAPFGLIVDLRNAIVDVRTSAEARQLAHAAQQHRPVHPSTRIAVVVSTNAMFGIARMYVTYRAQAGLAIEVFREMADAERWVK